MVDRSEIQKLENLIAEVQRRINWGETLFQGLSPALLSEFPLFTDKDIKDKHAIAKCYYLVLNLIQTKKISFFNGGLVFNNKKFEKLVDQKKMWIKISKMHHVELNKNLIQGTKYRHFDLAIRFMNNKMSQNG